MDDSSERRDRVLLRPWLENMLEAGAIQGLEWFDKDRMMFKVPWKHRSKKDWSLRHSSVFLEWARNTGRWSEGDPPPYFAQLKTRLRCAFNKAPDIEEMKEFHARNCEEPYKVYRFTTRKPGIGSAASRMTVPMTARRSRCGNLEHMVPNVVMDEEVVCSSVVEDTKLDISSSLANVKFKQGVSQDMYTLDRIESTLSGNLPIGYRASVGNGSQGDEKPVLGTSSALGVIPLTVELLSSDDSDDGCERKALPLNAGSMAVKGMDSRVGLNANKASKRVVSSSGGGNNVEPAAGSESKLLLLQMASMFVEAEASRHNSVDDEHDQSCADDLVIDDKATSLSSATVFNAQQAMDLTLRDNATTDIKPAVDNLSGTEEVIDLTSKMLPAEAVDLTQKLTPIEGRVLPLPRHLAVTSADAGSVRDVKSPLATALQGRLLAKPIRLPLTVVSSSLSPEQPRFSHNLTIRNRPLVIAGQTAGPVLPPRPSLTFTGVIRSPSRPQLSAVTGSPDVTAAPASRVPCNEVKLQPLASPSSSSLPLKPIDQTSLTINSMLSSALEQVTTVAASTGWEMDSSPSPSHNASPDEIRRHYRAKEKLLNAKAKELLDKEKQLIQWEKQLMVKQEALYWRERCLQHELGPQSSVDGIETGTVTCASAEIKDETCGVKVNSIEGFGESARIVVGAGTANGGTSTVAGNILLKENGLSGSKPQSSMTVQSRQVEPLRQEPMNAPTVLLAHPRGKAFQSAVSMNQPIILTQSPIMLTPLAKPVTIPNNSVALASGNNMSLTSQQLTSSASITVSANGVLPIQHIAPFQISLSGIRSSPTPLRLAVASQQCSVAKVTVSDTYSVISPKVLLAPRYPTVALATSNSGSTNGQTAERVVLPVLSHQPVISIRQPTLPSRILPLPVSAATVVRQTPPEAGIAVSQTFNVETRVLPPVYSQLPHHVAIETVETSDEFHDLQQEQCQNESITTTATVATELLPVATSMEPAFLENIRQSTERIVRQYHADTIRSVDMNCDVVTINAVEECSLADAGNALPVEFSDELRAVATEGQLQETQADSTDTQVRLLECAIKLNEGDMKKTPDNGVDMGENTSQQLIGISLVEHSGSPFESGNDILGNETESDFRESGCETGDSSATDTQCAEASDENSSTLDDVSVTACKRKRNENVVDEVSKRSKQND